MQLPATAMSSPVTALIALHGAAERTTVSRVSREKLPKSESSAPLPSAQIPFFANRGGTAY